MSNHNGGSNANASSQERPRSAVAEADTLERIAHQLEDVDRSLIDITEGLEKMHAQSENTNTILNTILLAEEMHTVVTVREYSELRRTITEAGVTAHEDAQQQARGNIIAQQRQPESTGIDTETQAEQAANIAEAVTLLRALFGDIVTAKLWTGRHARGLFSWFWEMGLPFWAAIFLAFLMILIKFYEIEGQASAAGVTTGTGGSGSIGRIETILAWNPSWGKLLERPRPISDNPFK